MLLQKRFSCASQGKIKRQLGDVVRVLCGGEGGGLQQGQDETTIIAITMGPVRVAAST